jgi:HAD superfamily hydrolase (TIGR01484 family)
MKSIREFSNPGIKVLFCDIDGTLTQDGRLPANSYDAMWKLHDAGVHVVPVTGRPAGWCELIARLWPVIGVIGENGALYFRYHNSEMQRRYSITEEKIRVYRERLNIIRDRVLKEVKGTKVASDQFGRIFDLAIDFAEDVPKLADKDILRIKTICEEGGAIAKISNIHVNCWFGDYDKLSMVRLFLKEVLNKTLEESQQAVAFIGDSPNDEPMFKAFQNSFAVANIREFESSLTSKPQYVADFPEALGFVQTASCLLPDSKGC